MRPLGLLIVGVGGQGVLTVARVLGDAAVQGGLEVAVGQLHGMAQRGGSVEATVVIGRGVHSSFVEQADLVLGLEPLETLRALPHIGPQTHLVVNLGRVVPFPLSMQGLPYPDMQGLLDQLRQATPHVTEVDGPALLQQLGDGRSLNLVMLGALARATGLSAPPARPAGLQLFPFDEPTLRAALQRMSPPTRRQADLRAYELGLHR